MRRSAFLPFLLLSFAGMAPQCYGETPNPNAWIICVSGPGKNGGWSFGTTIYGTDASPTFIQAADNPITQAFGTINTGPYPDCRHAHYFDGSMFGRLNDQKGCRSGAVVPATQAPDYFSDVSLAIMDEEDASLKIQQKDYTGASTALDKAVSELDNAKTKMSAAVTGGSLDAKVSANLTKSINNALEHDAKAKDALDRLKNGSSTDQDKDAGIALKELNKAIKLKQKVIKKAAKYLGLSDKIKL